MSLYASINITDHNNKLINSKNVPIIYRWNTKGEVIDSLRQESKIKEIIDAFELTKNIEDYVKGRITLFTYDPIITCDYKEYSLSIQEFYSNIDDDLVYDIIYKEIERLYELSFNKKPVYDASSEENIYDEYAYIRKCYNAILEKYKSKLTIDTIINAIRSHIQSSEYTKELTIENQEKIITKLTNLLNDGE